MKHSSANPSCHALLLSKAMSLLVSTDCREGKFHSSWREVQGVALRGGQVLMLAELSQHGLGLEELAPLELSLR